MLKYLSIPLLYVPIYLMTSKYDVCKKKLYEPIFNIFMSYQISLYDSSINKFPSLSYLIKNVYNFLNTKQFTIFVVFMRFGQHLKFKHLLKLIVFKDFRYFLLALRGSYKKFYVTCVDFNSISSAFYQTKTITKLT